MIYDDYIAYCEEYTQKYGANTVVFMQVGDFFELYAVINEQEKLGADIYRICELCNIQVSRKNKSNLENSRSNPLMAGFPISTISKFIQIMTQSNYTCVLIRQVTPPPNPKREVTEVISPSTTLTVNSYEGLYLMVVYWDSYKDLLRNRNLLNAGIATMDVTTGKSWMYEAYSTKQDPEFAKDEVLRCINLYRPKEIVFLGDVEEEQSSDIEVMFQLQNTTVHSVWNSEKVKPFTKPSYQNLVLEKVFGKGGIITPLESLHLERYLLATVAYCYMLQFAYEHNEGMIKDISRPEHWKNEKHLVLEANCIHQLNIDSINPNETPLLTILNRTMTAFGSRMFKEYLLNPIIDKKELEKQYDRIELFQKDQLYKELTHPLQSILDLERMIRKIGMEKFQPCEWLSLSGSLEGAKKVFQILQKKIIGTDISFKNLQTIMQDYNTTLNLEECGKYNMNDMYTSIFHEGVYPDIDSVTTTLRKNFSFLNEMCIKISNIGNGETTLCRLDCNERDGYHLTITKKRWELVHKLCPEHVIVENEYIRWKECKVKPLSATSSVLRLSHPKIDHLSDNILIQQRKISQLNLEYYKQYLQTFYKVYYEYFMDMIRLLGNIDIWSTNAKNANEFKYSRPTILEGTTSYLQSKKLRHPIIERLNLRTEYVANDIELGNNKKGLLLYGINASGKSSLMKSVGINVIMAQAGMFVAASEFTFVPYRHIFTRISGMDNIYRGLSTFTVEMLELKNILNRCDECSLILGDELCAGTEGISAISIVAAGIDYLLKKKGTFIFATHLHELLEIEFIQQNSEIRVAHMHIELDPITGKIIYDRSLKEGNGSSVYGLEVCRFLKMADSFLETANKVRKTIQRVPLYIIEPKVSKYNHDVYVSTCSLCGEEASETHHIKQQKDADEFGFIGAIHKDNRSNLIVLCEKCHINQHHGSKKIEKVVMTSDGIEPYMIDKPTILKELPTIDMKDYLFYSIQGWSYRLRNNETWKKLTPVNYEKVFIKLRKIYDLLPSEKKDIENYLMEHQSELLVFVK